MLRGAGWRGIGVDVNRELHGPNELQSSLKRAFDFHCGALIFSISNREERQEEREVGC